MVGRPVGCGVMDDLRHLSFHSDCGRKQERREFGWNTSRAQQRYPALVDLWRMLLFRQRLASPQEALCTNGLKKTVRCVSHPSMHIDSDGLAVGTP